MSTISLLEACRLNGQRIVGLTHNNAAVDGGLLLWTIAGLESTWGRDREYVRHEAGYMPGGKYYKSSKELRATWAKYGVLAASSFGSFQLMYQTAFELGYRWHPINLQDDGTCAHWATELITRRIINHQKAETLRDVLDAYNSGSRKDAIIPAGYIRNGVLLYEQGFEHPSP